MSPFLLLALACAAGPSELGTAADGGNDWGRFLGPTGDGKSAETGLFWEWPAEGPPVRWQREVGAGNSMASVAAGRLFMFDRHDDQARLTNLVKAAGLPAGPPAIGSENMRSAMKMDKKVQAKQIRFVLLRALGDAYVTSDFDDDLLTRVLQKTAS